MLVLTCNAYHIGIRTIAKNLIKSTSYQYMAIKRGLTAALQCLDEIFGPLARRSTSPVHAAQGPVAEHMMAFGNQALPWASDRVLVSRRRLTASRPPSMWFINSTLTDYSFEGIISDDVGRGIHR